MNIKQYQEIRRAVARVDDLERRLAEQERKYAAMCEVFEVLLNRKSGRPAKAEVERLENLQAQMNGSPN